MTFLSVLLSILFSIQASFIPANKAITFEGSREEVEFDQMGQNENGSFKYGVTFDTEKTDGKDTAKIVITNQDSNIYGLEAKITVSADKSRFKKTGFVTFNKSVSYTAELELSENETYTVNIKLCNGEKYAFSFTSVILLVPSEVNAI